MEPRTSTVLPYVGLLMTLGILVTSQGERWELSTQQETWQQAVEQCKHYGGHLATVADFNNLPEKLHDDLDEYRLDDDSAWWVGGYLVDNGWRWESGNISTKRKDNQHQIRSNGCYRQNTWTGGAILENISPRLCLDHCNWQGSIGLKKTYCLCENDLDLATRDEDLCHIPCEGNPDQLCGGILGTSMYGKVAIPISWAAGEPRPQHDCGLLRRGEEPSYLELISATCRLQTRYLCHFKNDDKCGTKQDCVRWSTEQVTWRDAKRQCETLNGNLAGLGSMQALDHADLLKIPSGVFWVSLRRYRSWAWLDGSAIPLSAFHRHGRDRNLARNCTVLDNIKGELRLSPRPCQHTRRFLCQYDDNNAHGMQRDVLTSDKDGHHNTTPLMPVAGIVHSTATNCLSRTNKGDDTQKDKSDETNTLVNGTTKWKFSSYHQPIQMDGELSTSASSVAAGELLAIGFVSGMLCMVVFGTCCIVAFRCRNPRLDKKRRHRRPCRHLPHDTSRENVGVSYNSSTASIRMGGLASASDRLHSTVSGNDESQLRQNQVRHERSKHQKMHAGTPSQDTNAPLKGPNINIPEYTWRGVIDGKIEIINTELRPPPLYKEQERNQLDVTVSVQNEATHELVTNNAAGTEKQEILVEESGAGFGDYDIPFAVPAGEMSGENNGNVTNSSNDSNTLSSTAVFKIDAIGTTSGGDEHIYATVRKVRKSDLEQTQSNQEESQKTENNI